NEVGRHGGQPLGLPFCPAKFDRHVLTDSVSIFGEPLTEALKILCIHRRRSRPEIADHRHRRLLRSTSHRPKGCASNQANKVAPSHPVLRRSRTVRKNSTPAVPSSVAHFTQAASCYHAPGDIRRQAHRCSRAALGLEPVLRGAATTATTPGIGTQMSLVE